MASEGRKQAANLNRIISEIPTEPLCANINSSNSRLPKEVNSSAQIRRLGNELAQESSVVTVPIELPRTNANDSLSRGQGEMTGEVAAFQRASPPTSKSKKRLRTKSGGDNDVSEKRKKKQGVTVNLQPDESPITNNSSKENSSKKEKKKKHKKKKSDENQIEKIVGPSTSGLSSSSNSASSQLIEKRGKKDVLNFCGHVGSIIQLIVSSGSLKIIL